MTGPGRPATADVAIVGGGVIGLTTAFSCASVGLSVVLVDDRRAGESSPAAAGMLAPSLEHADGPAHEFAVGGRDRYPSYLAMIEAAGGGYVSLNRDGILEIPSGETDSARLRKSAATGHIWLDPADVANLEPGCAAPFGALHHAHDGALDNVALLAALHRALSTRTDVTRIPSAALAIHLTAAGVTVRLADGGTVSAEWVVIAGGAWAPAMEGLPRPMPIEPVRGQMIGFASAATRHVLFGTDGYAVPRPDGRTIVGSTMERVGFDAGTTSDARSALARTAAGLCPSLASAPIASHWSGLRPVTPDLLPIIGPDPEYPRLIYACGHSRNGILMAAVTAESVAAIAAGSPSPFDLAPFSVSRFS